MTGAGCLILHNESPEDQMEAMMQADVHDNAVAQKFKTKLKHLRFQNLNFIERTYIFTFTLISFYK